jgi:hypothetical protein
MDLPTPRQLTLSFLFPFVVREGRLPSRSLLAWCCGNDLDLLLFGFLGLPIASLLAFGHVDLPGFEEKANPNAELVTLNLLSVMRAANVDSPGHTRLSQLSVNFHLAIWEQLIVILAAFHQSVPRRRSVLSQQLEARTANACSTSGRTASDCWQKCLPSARCRSATKISAYPALRKDCTISATRVKVSRFPQWTCRVFSAS